MGNTGRVGREFVLQPQVGMAARNTGRVGVETYAGPLASMRVEKRVRQKA